MLKQFSLTRINTLKQRLIILQRSTLLQKRPVNTSASFSTPPKRAPLKLTLTLLASTLLASVTYQYYKTINEKKKLDKISSEINNLQIVNQLESGNLGPYKKIETLFSSEADKSMAKESNLTQTTYRSPDKIPFPPRIYYNSQEGQSYEVHFAGSSLGDGNGNIHEGVISSLLDEAFARVAFQKFHTHYLFTANLSIEFVDKLKVDSFFLIHCQLVVNDKNYKAEIRAEVKEVDSDKVVANATGLFLVPKDKRHLIK